MEAAVASKARLLEQERSAILQNQIAQTQATLRLQNQAREAIAQAEAVAAAAREEERQRKAKKLQKKLQREQRGMLGRPPTEVRMTHLPLRTPQCLRLHLAAGHTLVPLSRFL